MRRLCVYALYDKAGVKPSAIGIRFNNVVTIYELWRQGAGKTLYSIFTTLDKVKAIILAANNNGVEIVTSDFKSLLHILKLPLDRYYNTYDIHIPDVYIADHKEGCKLIENVLERMSTYNVLSYHKLLGSVAVVYQRLESEGLLLNYTHVKPEWSTKSFSGRSKCSGFNVQGYHESDLIRPIHSSDRVVLVHFDWVCADIRVASLLSDDTRLQRTFDTSDPYDVMTSIINDNSVDGQRLERDEAKIMLLKAINSMDVENLALTDIYPDLGKWIIRCSSKISAGAPVSTILGRKFRLKDAKNSLAVLNGIMQGSVAHAMHNTLVKINHVLPYNIVSDVHDSLVMASNPEPADINALIKTVVPIMRQPFSGLLEQNPIFPVKVSIGKKWREWKLFKVYR